MCCWWGYGCESKGRDMARLNGTTRAYAFLFNRDLTIIDNTHEWCADGVSLQRDRLKNLRADAFPWRRDIAPFLPSARASCTISR